MLATLDADAASLVTQAVAASKLDYASEVLRMALLHRVGGIYVDNALEPPCSEGAWVDLRQLVPMAGLVASTASEGRNLGTSAVLLATDLLMAPPAHPVLAHLVTSFAANHAAWVRRHPPFDAQYAAGVFAFNRALSGALAVVPRTFLEHLEMARPVPTEVAPK